MTSTNSSRRTVDAADVTATGKRGKSATPSRDPEDIRADIERTRADLGDTVETLAGRADVKARARDKVAKVKTRAKDTAAGVTEGAKDTGQRLAGTARRRAAPLAGAVAAVTAAVGAVVMFRRRRSAKAKRRPWQRLPWRR